MRRSFRMKRNEMRNLFAPDNELIIKPVIPSLQLWHQTVGNDERDSLLRCGMTGHRIKKRRREWQMAARSAAICHSLFSLKPQSFRMKRSEMKNLFVADYECLTFLPLTTPPPPVIPPLLPLVAFRYCEFSL